MKPPPHTCPWIDQLQTIIRKNCKGVDRKYGLELCENLRGANLQLRVAYADAMKELNTEKKRSSLA